MKTCLFVFTFLLVAFSSLFAQTSIEGKILDADQKPLAFANVLLLHAADSTLIRGSISQEDGQFLLELIPSGDYLLKVSMIGFSDWLGDPFTLSANENQKTIPPVVLQAGVELEEVQIVARKPLFEQKIDRMVVNVENSVTSAGSSALEILERSPGVIVNRQNNSISLVGKSGVVVMINGKVNYMPTESIVQLLSGMNADNIEKIELITTPPANFDAEGNAGFINIVLKKRTDIGMNGSFSLSGGYGRGETGSANINLNYRKNKVNIFGSYSFSRDAQDQLFENDRRIFSDLLSTETNVASDRDPVQQNHNARLGLDYELNEQTVVGFIVSAYDNKWTMDAFNESRFLKNEVLDTLIQLDNQERNQWKHFSANLNLQHQLRAGEKLTFDLDYLHYEDENPNFYDNRYFDGANNLIFSEMARSDKFTPIDIFVGKADYTKDFNEKAKLSAGVKGSMSSFTNDVSVEFLRQDQWIKNGALTSVGELDERILAAYTAIDYQLTEKTGIKAGLRYEYTDSKLDTDKDGRVVDRQFGALFPSIFLSHTLHKDHSLNLSYSRRVSRPTFNDMAPFVIFLDPNTFFAGNAGLQPALSHSIKLDYRFKSSLLSLQYSHEDSTIVQFQERIVTETNQQFYEPGNLKNQKGFSALLAVPIYIGNWWQMQNSMILFWQQSNSFYNDVPVRFERTTFRANATQTFILPEDYSIEISGFYVGPTIYGTAKYQSVYGINMGIQKTFKNNWGTLRFNVNDIFNSIKWQGGTSIPEQNFETNGVWDFSQRTFLLTYSKNFGNNKLKRTRQRSTGSEEERNRVN
ncbi:MAG: TonB-dependent receptor [Bacteroidota bacterium]